MFSSILEQKSLLTPRAEGLRDALVIPGWLPTPTALDKLPWFAMVLLTSGARFALHIAFSASRVEADVCGFGRFLAKTRFMPRAGGRPWERSHDTMTVSNPQ